MNATLKDMVRVIDVTLDALDHDPYREDPVPAERRCFDAMSEDAQMDAIRDYLLDHPSDVMDVSEAWDEFPKTLAGMMLNKTPAQVGNWFHGRFVEFYGRRVQKEWDK